MPNFRDLLESKIVINNTIRDVHVIENLKGVIVSDIFLQSKVSEIQSLLVDHGIDDLSKIGRLEISENTIPSKGLLTPSLSDPFSLPQRLHKNVELLDEAIARSRTIRPRTRLESLWARPHKTTPISGQFPHLFSRFASVQSSAIDELDFAVWVGDEIVIQDDVTVLFTPQVTKLLIVANTLSVGDNVVFTHAKPDFDVDNSEIIPQKKARPQNRVPNRENERIHGVDGDDGGNGRDGQQGADAPAFELFAANFTGTSPSFHFSGQDGQEGQAGQQGQNGQDGARGSAAKRGGRLNGVLAQCERRSGSGGNGGDGGDGGDGGAGGTGGNGGQVTFYLTEDAQQALSGGFNVSLDPGRGGPGGAAGLPGRRGNGGPLGKSASTGILGKTSCGAPPNRSAGRAGNDGRSGEQGDAGETGTRFESGNVRFVTVDGDEIRTKLNSPLITKLSKYRARVGDSISVEGKNFPSDLSITFNGVEAPMLTSTQERVSVKVPDVEGGTVEVAGVYNNGNENTNVITLKVIPHIQSVLQNGSTPDRFKPGKPIRIQGTGFSEDLILMVNGRPSPDIDYISNNELEVKLVRPFEDNELPNALGEEVALKLIANEPGFASDEYPITLDTFRVLIMGDSIVWGQGLQDHEKFRNLLLEEIRQRKNHKGVYPEMHAHSGATIGYDMTLSTSSQLVQDDPNLPPLDGEVPTSYPTILQQMSNYLDGSSSDDTIDLILVDGGINDVSITKILHPLTKDDELTEAIDFHCYRGAKGLLEELVTRFSNAKILYTGYFKILSEETDMGAIDYLLTAVGFQVAGIAGAVGGYAINQAIRNEIIKHCAIFADRAHASMRLAIEEVKNENGLDSDHITFIDPGYSDHNAAFAPDSLLFGIGIPSLNPLDNDVVAVPRMAECALNEDRTSVWACERGSTGHPTPEGSEQYYLKILEKLDAIVPVEV